MENGIAAQKILGFKGLVVLLFFANMFIPLSTDIYLPALPGISEYFHCPAPLVNLSLISFFLFYALSIIFWGPLSDKYGRRPCLVVGCLLYLLASFGCALAGNIYILIFMRVLQGFGAGAITTLSMAIIKDCFNGRRRENILGLIFTMSGTAPIIAPLLGAQILRFATWRFAFWVLAFLGLLMCVFSLCYQETLSSAERYRGKTIGAYQQLAAVLHNRSFFYPVLIFAIITAPYMGYVSSASFIYEVRFGLSEQGFSYYFAVNAFAALFAPLLYLKFLRNINKQALGFSFACGSIISGLLIMICGKQGPLFFMLCLIPYTLLTGSTRIYSVNWILDQHPGDNGAASSLISSTNTGLSCGCMLIAAFFSGDIVVSLGGLIIVFASISAITWYLFLRSSIPCVGVKDIVPKA